jgi:hypothetical protein
MVPSSNSENEALRDLRQFLLNEREKRTQVTTSPLSSIRDNSTHTKKLRTETRTDLENF